MGQGQEIAIPREDPADRPILRVDRLVKEFGGLRAVNEVSFTAPPQKIVALIGPNGAGKTTVFNLISGVDVPSSGRIFFDGLDITPLRPYRVAELGVARTFQSLRLFHDMTCLENVLVGLHTRSRVGFVVSSLGLPRARREEHELAEQARHWLGFVGLAEKADQPAGGLSYGQQKMLEIARALAAGPRLLLLDEPAAGLTGEETATVAELILQIRASGVSVLLVEHDMGLVMDISDIVMVLEYGIKIAEGAPAEVASDPRVIEAYLGTRRKDAQPQQR